MIRIFLCLIVFPTIAQAEPISIRSGEHDTFSRLVLSIGTEAEWQVTQNSEGYILEVTGDGDGFNVGSVFNRIPRDRISDVVQKTPKSLSVIVECLCHSDAFLWRPGELVLDIIDGPDPDAPVPSEVAVDTSKNTPSALPDLLTMRAASLSLLRALEIPMAFQGPSEIPELQATEEALLEGLARAASQGFLTPAIRASPEPDEGPIFMPQPEDLRDLPGPVPNEGQPGIGISTAMDRDLSLLGDVLSEVGKQTCLPGDLFEIEAWANDQTLHAQIAALAEGLAGEFGQAPVEADGDLAKLYIYFGFGAEARAVLRMDDAMSQSRQVLVELANIADDYPGPYPLISTQIGCPGPAALWAFYAAPTPMDGEALNDILQQFFAVPQPLRGQVAPRLARRFVEIDEPDAASRILRASENYDVESTHDVQATRALIQEELDNPKDAIAVLEREVSDNARTTPSSLIHLIELELQQGQIPKEADLNLATAMRQEHRGTPIEESLAVAEAKGRSALGQYQVALDIVGMLQTPEAISAVDQAYAHMTENAPAATFLEFSFAASPDKLTASTENAIAKRLIDLGFAERAAVFLGGPAVASERRYLQAVASERRYLQAEAAVGMENYSGAIEALSGMTDPRANNLRASAYSGLGEFREALTATDREEQLTDDGTLEFRAAAWERLAAEDDEVLSSFAQAILTPSINVPAETLADRRAILSQSEYSRRAIEGLLLRFDGTTLQE